MKKLSIICAVLAMAALGFTSCQKEESTTDNQKFTASFEQAGNDKCSVDENLQMYWSENLINSLIAVYAPGFAENSGYPFSAYFPSFISADGKTAILEHSDYLVIPPFPAGQQGPFYAVSDAVNWSTSHINSDGSLHVGTVTWIYDFMPMVGCANNFGKIQFKHLMGILKAYVNLPEGYTASNVLMTTFNQAYQPSVMNGCDVTWDANGEITLSNIAKGYFLNSTYAYFIDGNGFFFCPACPGDWNKIIFFVDAQDDAGNEITFYKEMNDNASIHIERAGITTITLNMTMDDVD